MSVITSRFDSYCRRCRGKVSEGDQVDWVRGEGVTHIKCPLPEAPIIEENPQVPDGTYTVSWHEGDIGYVTIRVKTAGERSSMWGKRIVSFLSGPDNTRDFRGFGFLKGVELLLWRKFKTGTEPHSAIQKYVDAVRVLVEDGVDGPGRAWARLSGNCYRCGRELTVPSSIERGLGPICAREMT